MGGGRRWLWAGRSVLSCLFVCSSLFLIPTTTTTTNHNNNTTTTTTTTNNNKQHNNNHQVGWVIGPQHMLGDIQVALPYIQFCASTPMQVKKGVLPCVCGVVECGCVCLSVCLSV